MNGPSPIEESPTLTQRPARTHGTADRRAMLPPGGFGIPCSDHARPFQCSLRVDFGPRFGLSEPYHPVAVQSWAEVQATPLRIVISARCVLVGCTDQRDPFQRSASGWVTPPFEEKPTAMHSRGLEHETACRPPLRSGAGVLCPPQCRPFQRSASGCWRRVPTAVHATGELQDTPDSEVCIGPSCSGSSTQWRPFHLSVSARPPASPTAIHILAAAHAIPCSSLPVRRRYSVRHRRPSQRSITEPTTTHDERLMHETAFSPPVPGAARCLHHLPLKYCTWGALSPRTSMFDPTAKQ